MTMDLPGLLQTDNPRGGGGLLATLLTTPSLAIQLCLILMSVALWRRTMSPISDIPGPFFASMTRLWHVREIIRGKQNLTLIDLHERHGHFVRIAPEEVSVSHPDGIRKILLATIPKAHWYGGLALPDWRYIAPMTVTQPKAKMELSKALGGGYTLSNVLQAEKDVTPPIENLIRWMDQHAREKKPMELSHYISYSTLDVIGCVIFSKPFGFSYEGRDIDNAVANNEFLSMIAAITPFYRRTRNFFLTNPLMTWLKILPMGHVFDTAVSAISARAADPDARFDIASHWLRSMRENPSRLTLLNIQAQATNNIAAGAETVSAAVQTFVYHVMLRRHSTALDQIRKEIAEAQEKEGRCKEGDVVSYEDAMRLPYLQACIKEGLRYFTPVPMGLPREVPEGGEITIGGRTFTAGTVLSVNPWVVHRSREIWGEDAGEFNPERWFREGAGERERKWFIPFGAGYNSCPGHHVAKMELSKITATLARDYEVRQVNPGQSWKWKAYFTVTPHSWPVYVERRC